ncbi:MAG: hypothetical protein LAP21_28795 [Acidobacteriia bacterium]|nr:hypothetical protein [Terriglobia bacterium]
MNWCKVEKNGIGESADAVWRCLTAEHQRLFPARAECEQAGAEILPVIDAETP